MILKNAFKLLCVCKYQSNDESETSHELADLSLVNDNDKTIKPLSLDGEIMYGKVVDIYDGDTCKIIMPFKSCLYRWNCRLLGIDTPELRTKNEKEKECGYFVRDRLRELILNNIVIVRCHQFDKYGRLLVTIYNHNSNIKLQKSLLENVTSSQVSSVNDWLIEKKYAYSYDGGTKQIIEWNVCNLE